MTKLTPANTIKRSIAAAVKAEGSLRERYQQIGLKIIQHVKAHGDSSLMAHFYHEMGDSRYRAELSAWFRHFTGMRVEEVDGGPEVKYSFKKGNKPADVDLEGAIEQKFWLMKEKNTKDASIIDVYKFVEGVLKREEKIEPNPGDKVVKLSASDRDMLKNMVARHERALVAEKEAIEPAF